MRDNRVSVLVLLCLCVTQCVSLSNQPKFSDLLLTFQTPLELKESLSLIQDEPVAFLNLAEWIGTSPIGSTVVRGVLSNPTVAIALAQSNFAKASISAVDALRRTLPPLESQETYPFVSSLVEATSQHAQELPALSLLEIDNSEISIKKVVTDIPTTGSDVVDTYIHAWVYVIIISAVSVILMFLVVLFSIGRNIYQKFQTQPGQTNWHIRSLYVLPQMLYNLLSAIGLCAIYYVLAKVGVELSKLDPQQLLPSMSSALKDLLTKMADKAQDTLESRIQEFIRSITSLAESFKNLSLGEIAGILRTLGNTTQELEKTIVDLNESLKVLNVRIKDNTALNSPGPSVVGKTTVFPDSPVGSGINLIQTENNSSNSRAIEDEVLALAEQIKLKRQSQVQPESSA